MLTTDVKVALGVWTGTGATVAVGAGVDLTVFVGCLAARLLAAVLVAVRLCFLVAASAGPAAAGTTATAKASAARPVRSGVVTTPDIGTRPFGLNPSEWTASASARAWR